VREHLSIYHREIVRDELIPLWERAMRSGWYEDILHASDKAGKIIVEFGSARGKYMNSLAYRVARRRTGGWQG